MLGVLARPQAEAVVVFRREDQQLHARLLAHPGPLVGVEVGGVEDPGVLLPIAPLPPGKRVHAEVDEASELEFLPSHLRRRGGDAGSVEEDVAGDFVGRGRGETWESYCDQHDQLAFHRRFS